MAQRVKLYKKAGFRINDEMINVIGVLARDLVYQLAKNIYGRVENYGVIVSGIDEPALTEKRLFPQYLETPQPHVRVLPGSCITKEKKFVIVSEELTTTEIPSEDKVLWLIVDEKQTEEIVTHDIEGVIDYPVYINAAELKWYPVGIRPIEDGIMLGLFKAEDKVFDYSRIYRDIVVITGGLVWVGDENGKVVDFSLEPSVEPGISLHRFLACKGHAPRTIYNPFGLALEDIGGEEAYKHSLALHSPGIVFYEEGIYSEVFEQFRDRKYVPLYPKVVVLNGRHHLIFCVNQEVVGNETYYVIDDKYQPQGGQPISGEKGYILSEGFLRRYIKNCKIDIEDLDIGVYVVYVAYNSEEDVMEIKYTEIENLNEILASKKLPICELEVELGPVEPIRYINRIYNYAYCMKASRVRLYGLGSHRMGLTQNIEWKVDKFTNEKYNQGTVDIALSYEFVRRRGVAPAGGLANYETLKGNFIICDESSQLDRTTGHFLITDRRIELLVPKNDSPLLKLTVGDAWTFINAWGLNAQSIGGSHGVLMPDKLKVSKGGTVNEFEVYCPDETRRAVEGRLLIETGKLGGFRDILRPKTDVLEGDWMLQVGQKIGNYNWDWRTALRTSFSNFNELQVNPYRDFQSVLVRGKYTKFKTGFEFLRMKGVSVLGPVDLPQGSGLQGVSSYAAEGENYILIAGRDSDTEQVWVYLYDKSLNLKAYASIDFTGSISGFLGHITCYYYKVGKVIKILCVSHIYTPNERGFAIVGGYYNEEAPGVLYLYGDVKTAIGIEEWNYGCYIMGNENLDKFFAFVGRIKPVTEGGQLLLKFKLIRFEVAVSSSGMTIVEDEVELGSHDEGVDYRETVHLNYLELSKGETANDVLFTFSYASKSGSFRYVRTKVFRFPQLPDLTIYREERFIESEVPADASAVGAGFSYIVPLYSNGRRLELFLYRLKQVNSVVELWYERGILHLFEDMNKDFYIVQGEQDEMVRKFYWLRKYRSLSLDWWIKVGAPSPVAILASDYLSYENVMFYQGSISIGQAAGCFADGEVGEVFYFPNPGQIKLMWISFDYYE